MVRTIDPFKLGFPLNCAAAIMFGLWCIIWLRLASVHSHGWIDSSVCIGLFVAYASYRFYAALYSPADTLFIFASVGVLLASIQLTSIWLCLGKNRLVLRTAPFVLTIGLAASLVNCWHANPNLASTMVAGILPLTVGTMLALLIIRWIGVRFENVLSLSRDEKGSALYKESSINLRDLFLFTFVSAIVTAVVRWIPWSYWYGSLFDQSRAWHFLTLVGIFAACLVAVVVMSLWTIFSRRSIVVRWLPWIVALGLFQWLNLEPIAAFVIGAFATLNIGLHAYRQRGWRLDSAPLRNR